MMMADGPQMSFETVRFNGVPLVKIEGELCMSTGPRLEDELNRLAFSGVTEVHVDTSGVTSMDSTGLHVMLVADRALRQKGGRLRIVGMSPFVRRVLDITGTASHLSSG